MPLFQFLNERDPPPVTAEAVVDPRAWLAFQLPSGELHLSIVMPSGRFRTTSVILFVDLEQRSLITCSGRRYRLQEPPTTDLLLISALTTNAVRVGLGYAPDVSDRLWVGLNGAGRGAGLHAPKI